MGAAINTVDIPISAAKRIADEFGYDQVVIVARKVGGREHVTTYGSNKAHCDVAARMGNFFKHKLMGWPEPAGWKLVPLEPTNYMLRAREQLAAQAPAPIPLTDEVVRAALAWWQARRPSNWATSERPEYRDASMGLKYTADFDLMDTMQAFISSTHGIGPHGSGT